MSWQGWSEGWSLLEIIVGIAPLIGLVGRSPDDDALGGIARPACPRPRYWPEHSLILNGDADGTAIRHPSLIFWSYYTKKVETLAVRWKASVMSSFAGNIRERGRAQSTPIFGFPSQAAK